MTCPSPETTRSAAELQAVLSVVAAVLPTSTYALATEELDENELGVMLRRWLTADDKW